MAYAPWNFSGAHFFEYSKLLQFDSEKMSYLDEDVVAEIHTHPLNKESSWASLIVFFRDCPLLFCSLND